MSCVQGKRGVSHGGIVYNEKTMNDSKQQLIPFEDMPTWMRRAQQRVDWGVVLTILFSVLAAWPFIVQSGLPRTNATENHVFMAAEYAQTLREGRLYPRWSAAALSGYGAPIPHYYPPGAPYLAALTELLFTNDTVIAVRVIYILAIVLAGAMTYVFVLRWGGARAGVLAGVLYVYSPYIGMTAPHILGDLPGMIGLALLPTLLWSVHRVLYSYRAFDLAFVTLTTSGLLLTDPPMLLVASGGTLALLVWYAFTQGDRWQILRVTAAGLAGVALASFYWLPALWDWNSVYWRASTLETVPVTLHLVDLLTPLHRVDLAELVPRPQFTLGLALCCMSLAAGVTILRLRKWQMLYTVFLASGIGLLLAGLLLFPRQTWLLGPATWCLSVGSAAALAWVERLSWWRRRLMLPVLIIAILMVSTPVWLAPRWPGAFGGVTAYDQILYEQQGFGIAVLPPGESVPTTLPDPILPDQALIESYRLQAVARVSLGPFISGNQAVLSSSGTHYDRYVINTAMPTLLEILRADFPGWRVTLNGETLQTQRQPDSGLLRVNVPATHTGHLGVVLGTTPIRLVAWGVSWTTLLLLVLDTVIRLRKQPRHVEFVEVNLLGVQEARLVAIVFLGFVCGVVLFAMPKLVLFTSPYSLHARPGSALDNTVALRARTDSGLEALSYTLEKTAYTHGESLDFSVAWRTSRPLLHNYRVQVFLQAIPSGEQLLQTGAHHPAGYPTRRWRTGVYVRDFHTMSLTDDTVPPGNYQLAIEVYPCVTQCLPEDRLYFFDPQGNLLGQTLLLPPIITLIP